MSRVVNAARERGDRLRPEHQAPLLAAPPAELADLANESVEQRGCCRVTLHRTVDDPSTLRDTLAQRKRGLSPAAVELLRELLLERHWLFLGWSGADLEADPGCLGLRMASAKGRGSRG